LREATRPALFEPLALTAPRSILPRISDLQSQMDAAMEEAVRAGQKKREAAEALRARQHEYETAKLRGRQQQINRARAALEAAQAAYKAAKRDMQRLEDKAEEVVQAQVIIRAAYM
jgi:chromosome segregation ATPase